MRPTNLYHILRRKPALTKRAMPRELEKLAQALFASGKLRVDSDYKRGFVRYSRPTERIELTFSQQELLDSRLEKAQAQRLQDALASAYPGQDVSRMARLEFARLKRDLKKYPAFDDDTLIILSRLVVQAAHPSVIRMLLKEGTEVFISYEHLIGDLLDLATWREQKANSGMQSTSLEGTAVYISCGGDPLAHLDEPRPHDPHDREMRYGDGFPALARLLVIGAQELGHYADLIRDGEGHYIGRHSASHGGKRPSAECKAARDADIANVERLAAKLESLGLEALTRKEEAVRFYRKLNITGPYLWLLWLRMKLAQWRYRLRASTAGTYFLSDLPKDPYLGLLLRLCILDMHFNLSPDADAYKRPDPQETEAIACIESLARVPQQTVKWGEKATQNFYPSLYNVYFSQVISKYK